MIYNKLVRDKIPEIIKKSGKVCSFSSLKNASNNLFLECLNNKLKEEVDEYVEESDENKLEELADILEVVYSIGKELGTDEESLNKIRLKKKGFI